MQRLGVIQEWKEMNAELENCVATSSLTFKLRDGTSQCPFSSISKQDLLFLFFQGFIFTFWIFNPSKPDRFRSSRLTCRGSEQNASTRVVLALRRVRVGPRGPRLCLKIRMQNLSTLDAIWCHILHVFWRNGAFCQVPFRALLLSWHLNFFLPNLARPNVFLGINKKMQTVSKWIHLFERPRLLEKVWSRIKATAMMWSMMSLEDQRIWANCLWGLVTWGCLVEVACVVLDVCHPSVEGVRLWDCFNLESIESEPYSCTQKSHGWHLSHKYVVLWKNRRPRGPQGASASTQEKCFFMMRRLRRLRQLVKVGETFRQTDQRNLRVFTLTLLEGDVADWSLVALRKNQLLLPPSKPVDSVFSWGLDHVNRMAMNKVIKNDIVCVLDCSELVPLGFVLDQLKFLFPGRPVPDSAHKLDVATCCGF